MDASKLMAIVVVAVVAVAAVGGIAYYNNNKDSGSNEEVELSIAYLNLGYYPFMVGFEKGMFDDLGFKVKPVLVEGSGNVSVEALTSGNATMAATGDGPFSNAYGKYGDEIVGLCQYTQGSGSLAGHQWIVKNDRIYEALGDKAVSTIAVDENKIVTNSATVASEIKAISAAGEGAKNGKFMISVNNGSTTHNNLMKWCLVNNLTYTTDADASADVFIHAIPSATADILAQALDTSDAVACNSKLYNTISNSTALKDKVKKISDSSAINEASYSVLCTTKANYEKYGEQMLKVLEKLKEIYAWMDENLDEAAQIISQLNGETVEQVKSSYNASAHKIVWETDKLDAWVNTAKINGYTVTNEQFANSCPEKIRTTINGWYTS